MAETGFDIDEVEDLDQNEQFKKVRTQAKELEKQLKAAAKEREDALTELQQLRAEQRVQSARALAGELGLTDKQTDLFLKTNPEGEITKETLKIFAEDLGVLKPSDDSGTDTADQRLQSAGVPFVPITGNAAPGPKPGLDDFRAAYKRNPQAATAAAARGDYDLDPRVVEHGAGWAIREPTLFPDS